MADELSISVPHARTRDRLAELTQSEAHIEWVAGSDLLFVARNRRWIVNVKSTAQLPSVAAAAHRVVTQSVLLDKPAVPLVVVPYMTAGGAALCRDTKVSWLDLSGNAHIEAEGLYIHVEGKPDRHRRRGRPSNAFAPKSVRITRWILSHPGQAFTQQALSQATDLSRGFTSRIVRRLEDDGLLDRDEHGQVRPSDPDLLLDAWREAADFSRHRRVEGHIATRSGPETVSRLAEALDREAIEHAFTGLAAAWQQDRFAQFRLVSLYVVVPVDQRLMQKLGIRASSAGGNIWLLEPDDIGVLHGASRIDGIRCVHSVQALVDLDAHPERAAEAAEHLRQRSLRSDPT